MSTFCFMFFQYAQYQWMDPNATIKLLLQERTVGSLYWHGWKQILTLILPLSAEKVFPQTLAMPSTSLDRPLSEMVELTPCFPSDYIIYLFPVTGAR